MTTFQKQEGKSVIGYTYLFNRKQELIEDNFMERPRLYVVVFDNLCTSE